MPDRRDLKLDMYEISPSAYRELYYFCLQYGEMKQRLGDIYSISSGRICAAAKGADTSDVTAKKAIAAAKLRTSIELIERAARQADDEIDGYILRNVTEGEGYTYLRHTLGMPCGRNKFYKARRKFFYILWKGKGN
jgi:hypothetical protein